MSCKKSKHYKKTDLICVIREVHLVKDLCGFVLNGLHFHQMRRILPGAIPVITYENMFIGKQHVMCLLDCFVLSMSFVWACLTARLSAVSACSLGPASDASWTAETSAREVGGCYWEGKGQCKATVAPSPFPHCTCIDKTHDVSLVLFSSTELRSDMLVQG